jgi:crotonobetainyl-CoA:carnitine CoA-transferase CaiB-like acyl-CoA transferase
MPAPLAGLRALDLTDALGHLCGRLLADLGADVIKVEPPGGDPSRKLAPRHEGAGLYWRATNAGKRGVTLDLARPESAAVLADLAQHVDFVIESLPPDAPLAGRVAAVVRERPWLVHTSITPFGDRAPGRALHGDDLVLWATGGPMYVCGDEDRAPVRPGLWLGFCHAGAEAAVGTMLAHVARGRSGRGQRVVVNGQAAMVWTLMNAQAFPILHGESPRRSGSYVGSRTIRRRMIYGCADGYVALLLLGGQASGSTRGLIGWMDEAGMAPAWIRDWPWETWDPGWAMQASPTAQAEMERIEDVVAAFLATRTKAEIYREGVARRILVAPVATVADIAHDPQLAARGFFRPVEEPAFGRTIRYPGPFARLSATPLAEPRRPPEPGEHNAAVYGTLCGYAPERLATLRDAGVL